LTLAILLGPPGEDGKAGSGDEDDEAAQFGYEAE
jgi:hypothetical protein